MRLVVHDKNSPLCNVLVLAGGVASPEMARLTGEEKRALFPYRERTFIHWVCQGLRETPEVGQIAVVGPSDLQTLGLACDLHLEEGDSIFANVIAGMDALGNQGDLLITASDNPLLSSAAFENFLSRIPAEADLAYPLMPHARFLEAFPGAENIAVKTRDGTWIGGGCALIRQNALEQAREAILKVLAARKSKTKLIKLLGPGFILKFAMKRVTVPEVEKRAGEMAGLKFRFVHDCDPVFAIDIDDPEDWEYLHRWSGMQ